MATITFNIPANKLPRIINAIKGLYPIPMIEDPEWVDPEDGSSAPIINEFTDAQWAKERVRRFIISTVGRYERRTAMDIAAELVSVEDEIVT